MAVHSETHDNGDKMASRQLKAAQQHIAESGEIVKETTAAAKHGADKMLETGHAALSDGIDRSEKIARKTQAILSESLSPEIREKFPASAAIADGAKALQAVQVDMLRRYVSRAVETPRRILKSRSLSELTEIQHQYVIDSVNDMAEASGHMLEISTRVTQEALKGLDGTLQEISHKTRRDMTYA